MKDPLPRLEATCCKCLACVPDSARSPVTLDSMGNHQRLRALSRLFREAASIIEEIQLAVPPTPGHIDGVKPEFETAKLLTVDDVAGALVVSAKTVRRWREEGKLPPALRIGGVIRWRASEFNSWIEGQVA